MDVGKLPLKVRMIILGVIGVIALICVGIYFLTREKFDPEVLEARKAVIEEGYTKLGVIYDNLAGHGYVDEAVVCDDSIILEKHNHDVEKMPFLSYVDYEFLAQFSSNSEPVEYPSEWDWVNGYAFRNLKPLDSINDMLTSKLNSDTIEEFKKDGHIIVLSLFKEAPSLTESKKSFFEGYMDGGLYVVDYDTAEIMCYAPFTHSTSESFRLETNEFKKLEESDLNAVWKDLETNYKSALEKSLGEISKEAKISG